MPKTAPKGILLQLSIAFADKAIVCFIIAIFQKFMMSKPGLMLNGKNVFN